MRALGLACAILFLSTSLATAQRTRPSPGVTLVRQLYADFACEAVIDSGCDSRHEFVDQPKSVLAKYFDDNLVKLWLADRRCAARTHEICNLDFSPIWDSQDPSGSFVNISQTPDSAVVQVELRHPYYKEARLLDYRLVKTAAGWRIHDISRRGEWSLVGLLSRKPTIEMR